MAFAKKKNNLDFLKEMLFPIVSLVVVLAIVWIASGNISNDTDTQLLEIAQQAVVRSAVQCYALEGVYPQSLDYLKDNYGLYVDDTKYVIHYQNIGGNLMPQISVFLLQDN